MKKFFSIGFVFSLVLISSVVTKQVSLASQEPADSSSQDAERNRELLEIWKDHVKTLTKERNAAYKELEQLKASHPGGPSVAPMAQFGGMETQALPSPAATQQIEGLQSEVARLQAALDQQSQATPSSPNRELQMQFSALQTQLQQTRKELSDTHAEKDRLIQEKEKALSQVDRMKTELESAQSAPAPVVSGADQEVADNLQKALNIQKKRYEDLQTKYTELDSEMESLRSTKGSDDPGELRDLQSQLAALRVENAHLKEGAKGQPPADISGSDEALRQAREIQYENETLRARIEKLQAVEKELSSTRGYFTPLVKDLQTSNQKISSENESLKAEFARGKTEYDNATRQVQQFSEQNQQLAAEVQSMKADQEEATNQIAGLKSQVQLAAADREKYKSLEEEAQRLSTENKSLHGSYTELQNNLQSQEAKFRETAAQFSSLQKSNDELQARDAQRSKQIETYKTSLRANLTDMKNLKSNFESYLDSLVTSFDEREN